MLAVDTYKGVGSLKDSESHLNLSWTSDERALLAIDMSDFIARHLVEECESQLGAILSYPVSDPYFESAMGTAVGAFFGNSELASLITCCAGVNAILCALSHYPAGREVGIVGDVYPDFPHWTMLSGRRCIGLQAKTNLSDYVTRFQIQDRSIIFFERPNFFDSMLFDLSVVKSLCKAAEGRSLTIVIDESNANYLPPRCSAVDIVTEVSNLIVIRGFSKAYGLGGIRLAYCVSSREIKERVRSIIPPLSASPLSVSIGRKLLNLGDIFGGLRARIASVKEYLHPKLIAAGYNNLVPTDAFLPYFLIPGTDLTAIQSLASLGIAGKRHVMWSSKTETNSWVYRVSTPLLESRVARLVQCLENSRIVAAAPISK